MKHLLFALAAGLALTAPPVRADDPAVSATQAVQAENQAVPGPGFPASRYEALWTKSPFAVATSEAAPESPDYSMVGIANVEGISYASLIERQSQEHFLISTDQPIRGLTLTSITRNGPDTYAVVQKDGQPITLKLEQPPAMAAVPGAPPNTMSPGGMTPQITMPGAAPTFPNAGIRPARFHRPPIYLPPQPAQQQQPVQVHPPPPP